MNGTVQLAELAATPPLPIGFVALWRNKRSEYHASADEQAETTRRIEAAFAAGEARGIRMFGRFGCRWSSEWQYFTFWRSPTVEAVEETMDLLEHAGDFKFADSLHLLGVRSVEQDLPPGPPAPECRPFGFVALWRRTRSHHRDVRAERAADAEIWQIFDGGRAQGVEMLGHFRCGWSSAWEAFTFWRSPTLEAIEGLMGLLEGAGDFWFADSQHLVGVLEPSFRFGRHLQEG